MGPRSIQELMLLALDAMLFFFVINRIETLSKEAMELSVYACILAPFKEWEVLTMIRNILAKRNREDKTSPTKIKPQNIRAK